MSAELWINIFALIITAGGIVAGVTWRLSQVQANLIREITINRREIDIEIARVRNEASADRLALANYKAEVSREYIARATFYPLMDKFHTQIFATLDKLMARMDTVAAAQSGSVDRVLRALNRRTPGAVDEGS